MLYRRTYMWDALVSRLFHLKFVKSGLVQQIYLAYFLILWCLPEVDQLLNWESQSHFPMETLLRKSTLGVYKIFPLGNGFAICGSKSDVCDETHMMRSMITGSCFSIYSFFFQYELQLRFKNILTIRASL